MYYVPVILGSIRRYRQSAKVAKFALRHLQNREGIDAELLDLKELDLPMMEERLRFRNDAPPNALDFSARIDRADSVLIVAPEYSGGYPGVLKNALDYIKPECSRKPFGIITVSASSGGSLCLAALRQLLLHLGGVPIPESLPVTNVREAFDEDGNPADPAFDTIARSYFDEFLWFTQALSANRRK